MDIVFVHGLGGDKHGTWQGPEDAFWPTWLAEDLPGAAVWSLGYDASSTAWMNSPMSLLDRGANVLERLHADGLGARPLVFICHSLGGLVVKQLLRAADDSRVEPWRRIAQNTRGIAFLGTPHAGSRIADFVKALGTIARPSAVLDGLAANEPSLRDLSRWYSDNHERMKIETVAFFETRDTFGVRVVDETSANPGGAARLVPVDADHLSLSKPASRTALVYASVRKMVGSLIPVGLSRSPLAEPRLPQPGVKYKPNFYVRRKWEDQVAEALEEGNSVTAYGAESFGKTWFVNRVRERLPHMVWLEWQLRRCDHAAFDHFLLCLTEQFCEQLERLQPDAAPAHARPSGLIAGVWAERGLPKPKFDRVLRGYRAEVLDRVVVVCDDVDVVLPSEKAGADGKLASEFITFLQARVQKAAPGVPRFLFTSCATADRMNKVLGISSPFTRTLERHLEDLGAAEMALLARTYGLDVSGTDIEHLMNWVGGHPFLASIAFERVAVAGSSLLDLKPDWFLDHADRLRRHLDAEPALKLGMQQVCAGANRVAHEDHANQLRRRGLVVGEQGALAPRNALYRSFWAPK